MDDDQLEHLLTDLESDRVERKAASTGTDKICQAICAFANDLENFGQPGVTDYRNPNLAEAMKVLGYVQRFGLGIPLAREELKKNGNPPPEFSVEHTHVLVTVRTRA